MNIEGYEIHPLTPDRFGDFEKVLGRGGVAGCWCMYWITPTIDEWRGDSRGGGKAKNRDLFRVIVEAGPPPGLLAYIDDEPAAWCRIMPRDRLAGLANSANFKTDLDIAGVWSLPCFVVRRKFRGRGLTSVLTRAAMQYAREHGARILEAYPTETTGQKNPASVYTGVASTFARLGFEVVQRTKPHKPMMRLRLSGARRR
ncbi:GNAT family N-acetyltransferase [bacterium]|nr:GNAT family N-acetyltransferase [bacterium]